MEELKILTAEEAKELTNTSKYLRNTAYREIKEAAIHNRNMAYIYVNEIPKAVYKSLEEELKSKGYLISYLYANEDTPDEMQLEGMRIMW